MTSRKYRPELEKLQQAAAEKKPKQPKPEEPTVENMMTHQVRLVLRLASEKAVRENPRTLAMTTAHVLQALCELSPPSLHPDEVCGAVNVLRCIKVGQASLWTLLLREFVQKNRLVTQRALLRPNTGVILPLSEDAQRAMDCALAWATTFKHKELNTEHLLLGLLRNKHNFAAKLVHKLGVDPAVVVKWITDKYLPAEERELIEHVKRIEPGDGDSGGKDRAAKAREVFPGKSVRKNGR